MAEAMVQSLSSTLIEIYEKAEVVPANNFLEIVLRLIWPLFHFDGVLLRMGHTSVYGTSKIASEGGAVQPDAAIIDKYALLVAADPAIDIFIQGLERPVSCSCIELNRPNKLVTLKKFVIKHEISQLLMYGMLPTPVRPASWAVLYRENDDPFGALQENNLMAIWPHLLRSVILNRAVQPSRRFEGYEVGGTALLNHHGWIQSADPFFRQLLILEWRDCISDKLPEQVLRCLHRGVDYKGTHIHLSMKLSHDYIVCYAVRKNNWHSLTKAERVVAGQFATGVSYKKIAQNLNVSLNTVRSHLKHVYEKLKIHDKATLANLLAENSEHTLVQTLQAKSEYIRFSLNAINKDVEK
jgi:DNA-binding CsgD family transcriptional regulator